MKQQQQEANELQTMHQSRNAPTDTKTSCQAKDVAHANGKPFCKVCFDAGKTEKEYTSHYVKSTPGPTGKVVCPTLLIQACLNCGQPGHTSGYCDQAKSQHNPRYNQSNQHRTQPTIVLSHPRPMIGAEAELKLMTTMFKSKTKNDDFPSLKSEPNEEPQHKPQHKQEPKEEETHAHVYNPKSNPFGALTLKQPKQPNQKSFQPPKQPQESQQQLQSPAKPMTMAERLKHPAPIKSEPKPKPVETAPIRPKFADMPPKSQFWWQDEDD